MADATNTAGGLVQMREMFEEHGREDAAKIAVLLTDGRSNIDSELTIPEAENAKNEGIDIYVVGTSISHSLFLPLSLSCSLSSSLILSRSLTMSSCLYIMSLSATLSLCLSLPHSPLSLSVSLPLPLSLFISLSLPSLSFANSPSPAFLS